MANEIERTEHLPGCPEVAGGDCDCGPVPAEVWCRKCDQPSLIVVRTSTGEHAECRDHALDTVWSLGQTVIVR